MLYYSIKRARKPTTRGPIAALPMLYFQHHVPPPVRRQPAFAKATRHRRLGMRLPTRSLGARIGPVLLSMLWSWPALAHPHVWITAETTVLYENGAFTGLRHRWTFDEFY